MQEPPLKRRLVIVDDDQFMLTMITAMLGRIGEFDVQGFTDAPAAFRSIRDAAAAPDLVILDINMPEMDGMAFFRQLADIGFRGCVALCSGESDSMLRTSAQLARSYGLRVGGTLPKPPRPDLLRTLLAQCEGERESRRSPASGRERRPEELRDAIEAGDIFCVYQPKIDISSGRLVGVEALARWRHRTDGIVPPAEFIPMAERTGSMPALTRCVFDLALGQLARWREAGIDLIMSVNASVHDLADLSFPDFLNGCAERHRVNPAWVIIEVTESGLTEDERLLVEIVSRLRLRRFQLSIDDFGNGYSTMAKLRDLVFDELKIDQGFTHGAASDERKAAIFHASVQIAKRLGMKIVAEGVEDQADWDFCRINGADVAQGYFMSRPLAPDAMEAWLAAWRLRHGAQFPDGVEASS